MSNFTQSVVYETEFDGDKLTCTLRRLKRKTFLKLAPYVVDGGMDQKKIMEFLEELGDEFFEYVEIEGLKDSHGVALTAQDVFEETYFITLMAELLGQLMVISTLGKEAKSD